MDLKEKLLISFVECKNQVLSEALHKGRQFHCYAIKAGVSSDMIIEGSLLDFYVKCSDVATTRVRSILQSTNKENVVLGTVIRVAYGKLG
ncbi:hypothetical protein IFM89_038054 [Coptis chinensis]|uniref:Uncharacterized protein n=1 Tax=Coptis chinensis TaxID=261450 RepID=A0A835HA53_9MAGN|nr:hypothetical protein IFM89_038054 [Coptis chinensis]